MPFICISVHSKCGLFHRKTLRRLMLLAQAPEARIVLRPGSQRRACLSSEGEARMKPVLVFVLITLAVLGWFVGPEPASLLLFGTALTGIGVLARRVRSSRKDGV